MKKLLLVLAFCSTALGQTFRQDQIKYTGWITDTLNTRVNLSDSTLYTTRHYADSSFGTKVNYLDSTTVFFTPTQALAKVNYSDTGSALVSSASKTGFLKYSDWSLFNSKQPGGIYLVPSDTTYLHNQVGLKLNKSDSTTYSTRWHADSALGTMVNVANVKSFGAMGNGIANDSAAIQSAINSSYNIVYFPPGTYLCRNISLAANKLYLGSGASTIKATTTTDTLFRANMISGWTMENLNFLGSLDTSTQHSNYPTIPFNSQIGVFIKDNYAWMIKNCKIYGIEGYGIYGTNTFPSIFTFPSGYFGGTVSGCLFQENYYGFYAAGRFEYNTFLNNYCTENVCGVYNIGGNNVYSHSHFDGNTTGFRLNGVTNDSHGSISNSTFNHNYYYGIYIYQSTTETISSSAFYTDSVYCAQSQSIMFTGCIFNGLTQTFRFDYGGPYTMTGCCLANNVLPPFYVTNNAVVYQNGCTYLAGNYVWQQADASPGFVSIPDTVSQSSLTTSVAATNFVNTATGHLYKANYYLYTTTSGTGTTVSLTLTWNDGAAKSFTSATASLSTTDITGVASGSQIMYVSSGTPQWSTTVNSIGTSVYGLRMALTRLY